MKSDGGMRRMVGDRLLLSDAHPNDLLHDTAGYPDAGVAR